MTSRVRVVPHGAAQRHVALTPDAIGLPYALPCGAVRCRKATYFTASGVSELLCYT